MDSLCVREDDGHRVGVAPEQIRRHDEREVHRRHLRRLLDLRLEEQLQEADDEQHHTSVDRRQAPNERDARARVVRAPDALVVQFVGDERVQQFTQPELEQRRKRVRVLEAVERVVPAFNPQLQLRDIVTVARNTEDALRLRTT